MSLRAGPVVKNVEIMSGVVTAFTERLEVVDPMGPASCLWRGVVGVQALPLAPGVWPALVTALLAGVIVALPRRLAACGPVWREVTIVRRWVVPLRVNTFTGHCSLPVAVPL